MNIPVSGYRLSDDAEPDEKALSALMHEVSIDAVKKFDIARQELQRKIKVQISEALVREGFRS